MYNKIIFSWITIMGMALSTLAQHAEAIHFTDSSMAWKKLLAMAQEKNRPVFLDCYTSWCGPCKKMSAEVFTRPATGQFMNEHFINAQRDMEKGEGKLLYQQYKQYIPGFPTFLLINADGTVLHQASGFMETEQFIAEMQQGLEGKGWIGLDRRYKAGERDWTFLDQFLGTLKGSYQFQKAAETLQVVGKELTTDAMRKDSGAFHFFIHHWQDAETPLFRAFLTNDVSISGIYKLPEHELEKTENDILSYSVDRYHTSVTSGEGTYDPRGIDTLLYDIDRSHASNRQDLLAHVQLIRAVHDKDHRTFFFIAEAIENLGLLRYTHYKAEQLLKAMLTQTESQEQLEQCLHFCRYLARKPRMDESTRQLEADIQIRLSRVSQVMKPVSEAGNLK